MTRPGGYSANPRVRINVAPMTPDRIPATGVKVAAQAVLMSSDVLVGEAMTRLSLHAISLSRPGRVAPLRADIVDMTYRFLHPDCEIAEVRIPKTEQGTLSGYFDHPIKLIHAIAPLNGKHSIYLTLNRLKDELRARAWNRLARFCSTTTRDGQPEDLGRVEDADAFHAGYILAGEESLVRESLCHQVPLLHNLLSHCAVGTNIHDVRVAHLGTYRIEQRRLAGSVWPGNDHQRWDSLASSEPDASLIAHLE